MLFVVVVNIFIGVLATKKFYIQYDTRGIDINLIHRRACVVGWGSGLGAGGPD